MAYRDPHSIVPRDDKDDILLAIYDVLVDIRASLASAPDQGPAPAPADVSETLASAAGAVLATHGHDGEKKPPAKPAAKKSSTRKTTTGKKPKA